MSENRSDSGALPEPDQRHVDAVVQRLVERYAGTDGLHRDVIEAAVRIGWARYEGARVKTYQAILAERAAVAALQHWFGPPARAARPPRDRSRRTAESLSAQSTAGTNFPVTI